MPHREMPDNDRKQFALVVDIESAEQKTHEDAAGVASRWAASPKTRAA